jgi:hypothetical protein
MNPICLDFVSRDVSLGFSGEPCSPVEVETLERQFRIRFPSRKQALLGFRHVPG